MTVLPNIWAKLFFYAYTALFAVGFVIFVKNILRKDWDYEMRFPWSLRGLVYLFAWVLWFITLPVAVWFYRGDRNRRKFAVGLFCLSAIGVCFTLAGVFGMAVS